MTIEHKGSLNMEVTGNMNRPSIDKMDPRYIVACMAQLPTLADPLEVGIIDRIRGDIFKTPLGRRMIEEEKEAIIANLKSIYARRHDSTFTLAESKRGIAEASKIINATIVSGEEHLDGLTAGRPVFFSANHYGAYKLVGLTPEDLLEIGFKNEHAIPDIYYSPTSFVAPFYPVAERLGDGLCLAAFEEPGILGELSRAAGYIDVSPASMIPAVEDGKAGRTETLVDSTRDFFKEHPDYATLVFPEGGTTGKRSGGKIYELGKFHSGLFAIASQLDIPVVLLAHDFNPSRGFEVAIAGVTRLGRNSNKEEIQSAADHAQRLTQLAVNSIRSRQ